MCGVDEASLTLDMLQLSQSSINSVVRSYLSPTPVKVGGQVSEQVLYGQCTRLYLSDKILAMQGYVSAKSLAMRGYISAESLATWGYVSAESLAPQSYISAESLALWGYISAESLAMPDYVSIRSTKFPSIPHASWRLAVMKMKMIILMQIWQWNQN